MASTHDPDSILDLGLRPTIILGDPQGPGGNHFVIMADCKEAFKIANRQADIPMQRWMPIWEKIQQEMTSGGPEHFLEVVYRFFKVGELRVNFESASLEPDPSDVITRSQQLKGEEPRIDF